jgi:hypothetical protein
MKSESIYSAFEFCLSVQLEMTCFIEQIGSVDSTAKLDYSVLLGV